MGVAKRKPRQGFVLPSTQEEFEAWCTGPDAPPDGHYEFLFGCVVAEPPARWPHGESEVTVAARLLAFVRLHDLGRVFGSSQGFALPSGDTVAPDVSVILHPTWAAGVTRRPDGFLRVVPDLVVEILSPGSAGRDRGPKREIYERNGVREYWLVGWQQVAITVLVIGPEGRFVEAQTAHRSERARSRLLPGFALRPDDVVPADAH